MFENINLVLENGLTYFRFSNSYAEFVKKKLIKQYSDSDSKSIDDIQVALTSSGMQAISTIMHVVMSSWGWEKDACIVLGDEMYCDTPRAAFLQWEHGTRVYKVTIEDNDKVINLFEEKLKNQKVLFLIEPCTNPNGNIFDFSIVPKLRQLCKKLILVADITWTPEFNPLKLGADAIALSLTKHHSGSSCIMGAVISPAYTCGDECECGKLPEPELVEDISDEQLHEMMNGGNASVRFGMNEFSSAIAMEGGPLDIALKVSEWINASGGHISPYDSSILLEKIIYFTERIDSAYNETIKLASELEKKEWVKKVNYPRLPSHPSFKLAIKYNMRPTVLNVLMTIPGSIIKVEKMLKSRKHIRFATSYGGPECRIDPWYKKIPDTSNYWIRLAVGYESKVENIISDLEECMLT